MREPLADLARRLNRPVDLAAVALFRVAAGLLAFAYFTRCLVEAERYGAPDGLVDHALSEAIYWFTAQPLLRPGSPPWWPSAVYGAAMASSLLLALGVRARWNALALYVLLACSYRWGFLVLYVDDAVVHLALFWAALLPETKRFTLRSFLRRENHRPESGPGATVRLCLANVAILYAVAGSTKCQSPMWRDGSALFAVLRHPIAWRPALVSAQHLPPLRLLAWTSLALELALPLLAFLPRGSRAKYLLLLGAVALHLGIALTLDLVFANLGCLALLLLAFHAEVADALRAPPPPAEAPPWAWRERVAAVTLGLLAVAMGGSALQPQWRHLTAARRDERALLTPETGGALQTAAFAGLWCMGLAQQYRLLDWIDERDVHVVRSRTIVATPDGAARELPFDALVPRTTRGVLLVSYLAGFTWSPVPLGALPRLRASIADRVAARFCRARRGDATVRGELTLDRTSAPDERIDLTLTFRCEGGAAREVRWRRAP